jgi:cytochrome c oxidase subunit 2
MRILSAFFPAVTADVATPWQLGFQDPASPTMQGIVDLHHDIMFFIVGVVIFVTYMMVRCLMHFTSHPKHLGPDGVTHGTTIEIIWTITPSLILVLIALPSFALLYSMDEVIDPSLTLKVVGHQWYWTYEYSDYATADDTSIVYDSYMIPEDDLEAGQLRLLEVDNRVVLPVNTHIRVIITGADVLHSWAVPSLAVKCDGVPGRLNQVSMYIDREGIFYGQCSELCGVNHGFMPIVVEAVSLDDYVAWVAAKLEEV